MLNAKAIVFSILLSIFSSSLKLDHMSKTVSETQEGRLSPQIRHILQWSEKRTHEREGLLKKTVHLEMSMKLTLRKITLKLLLLEIFFAVF